MDADGTIEIILSPDEHPQPWIRLEPDAVCAITRDYLIEPDTGRRMEWRIECLDGDDEPLLTDDGSGGQVPCRPHLDRGPGEDHAAAPR